MIYCDTSVLLKLYIREKDSNAWIDQIQKHNLPLTVSFLHQIEIVNALTLLEYRSKGEIRSKPLIARFEEDLAEGIYQQLEVDLISTIQKCQKISQKITAVTGLRTLDLMHLALAFSVPKVLFLTADDLQQRAANQLGMKTE